MRSYLSANHLMNIGEAISGRRLHRQLRLIERFVNTKFERVSRWCRIRERNFNFATVESTTSIWIGRPVRLSCLSVEWSKCYSCWERNESQSVGWRVDAGCAFWSSVSLLFLLLANSFPMYCFCFCFLRTTQITRYQIAFFCEYF